MDRVTISELRNHIADWVGRAAAGQEVIILRGGQPVARIVPIVDRQAAAERRLSEVRRTAVVGDIISPVSERDWASQA